MLQDILQASTSTSTSTSTPVKQCMSFTNKQHKVSLIYNNYIYHHLYNNTHWRCKRYQYGCDATINTDPQFFITHYKNEHNHEAETPQYISKILINGHFKEKSIETPDTSAFSLVLEWVTSLPYHDININDFNNFKRIINRERSKSIPPLPNTFEECIDMLVNQMEIRSISGSELIYEVSYGIVMLASDFSLKLMKDNCSQIFSDGSFKHCPTIKKNKFIKTDQFYQFYTFHVLKNDFYIPTVCFLLKEKSAFIYSKMIGLLKKAIPDLHPHFFIIDFEKAMFNSLCQNFSAQVRFCHFHLGQSWMKKIINLGLKRDYVGGSVVGNWLLNIFSLPYFEPSHVPAVFKHYFKPAAPKDNIQLQDFISYLEDNYVNPNSSFPPENWAGLSTTECKTTNNGAESFHLHFGQMFGSAHPNIYAFLRNWYLWSVYGQIKANSESSNPQKVPELNFSEAHRKMEMHLWSIPKFISYVKPHSLPIIST